MRTYFVWTLLVIVPSLVLCQMPNDVRGKIQSILDKQAAAWNNGDVEGYMQGYWKSESLLFTSGGNMQRGWRATLEKYKKSYNTKEKMGHLNFSDLEFHLLSSDCAWVFGHWEIVTKPSSTGGVFTLVFKKFSDGWKIVHDHTSSNAK